MSLSMRDKIAERLMQHFAEGGPWDGYMEADIVLQMLATPTDDMLQAFEDEFVIQFGAAPSNPWTRGEKLLHAMIEAAKEPSNAS